MISVMTMWDGACDGALDWQYPAPTQLCGELRDPRAGAGTARDMWIEVPVLDKVPLAVLDAQAHVLQCHHVLGLHSLKRQWPQAHVCASST